MTDKTRTALIGIIVEDTEAIDKLNDLLHEYRGHIIGRMGVPHPSKEISIISIALDASDNIISALAALSSNPADAMPALEAILQVISPNGFISFNLFIDLFLYFLFRLIHCLSGRDGKYGRCFHSQFFPCIIIRAVLAQITPQSNSHIDQE